MKTSKPMNTVNYSELKFPVIWITRILARVCADERHLCSFDSVLVNAGHCNDVTLVDANLIRYEARTTKRGGVPPLWGFRLNLSRVGSQIRDYLKSEPRSISVSELSEMVHEISGRSLSSAVWLPGEREELRQTMTSWEKVLERLGGVKKRKWWEGFWFNKNRF